MESLLGGVRKPARYVGGELHSVLKDKEKMDLRVCFCFPDTYEIGMSHLGLGILYGLLNEQPDIWCERAFTPWPDMAELLRQHEIPLYGLESGDPLREFDMLAFTLQYELCYTNVLEMFSLGGVPLRVADRGEDMPVVIAGGPCAYNPEPLADFIDIFALGEGEEVMLELAQLCKQCKPLPKRELLRRAAQIPGVYVPALYEVSYNGDGTVAAVTPESGAPAFVMKRIVQDMDKSYYPLKPIVSNTEIVHDRVMLELFRGCLRGCRFCQAGFTNRPVRARSAALLAKQGRAAIDATGQEEIALTSLSTSDYGALETLCDDLLAFAEARQVNLSLPSLRADSFSRALMERVQRVRKSGLTFAPEAGSARLRDVINKNLTEEDLLTACATAFEGGWGGVKLYFMMGHPTETDEDVLGIAELAHKVYATWRRVVQDRSRGVRITVSVACFVPKPHTPFQWFGQNVMEEFERKQKLLKGALRKQISFSWHAPDTSVLEAAFARGDRKLGAVLEEAWRAGCRLDGWSEFFSLEKWRDAFARCGLDPAFYANRQREEHEVLPWDHLRTGVSRKFLWREYERALAGTPTPDCRASCSGCGADQLVERDRLCTVPCRHALPKGGRQDG